MHQVHGRAQHYAWGDADAIPQLLGRHPDGRPWAEWWLGTHHLAPSTIDDGRPLQSVAGELPFLLKLTAAAEPLSLQSHPDRQRAEQGFEREERAGVPIDSPERIYKDRFAKPELLCAVRPFDTLSGFRPVEQTLALLEEIGAGALAHGLRAEKLAGTVAALYHGELDITPTLAACARSKCREAVLVNELAEAYPGDPSVVVTLLLNRVLLSPGEAVFLGPGNLHAYLRGFGVEIMANSDNVIRSGMTVKHVDVDELLDVLDFEPLEEPRARSFEVDPGVWRYQTPPATPAPFVLWRYEIRNGDRHDHRADAKELLLWVAGERQGECVYLDPGEEVSLPGPATVFRAQKSAAFEDCGPV
ncbi:MAG TPA: mannose-6-phosphate isomerase, class I [Ilumatobacteraceae bacterium]|nr:mannose-6-phosphate isomerase, class I [Ilumatobacteraceae bacterium]